MPLRPSPPKQHATSFPPAPKSTIRVTATSDTGLEKDWDDDDETSRTMTLIPLSTRASGRPRITVMTGMSAGRVFPLDTKNEFVIGRSRHADIRIEDPGVSREHCRLLRRDGRVYVEDLSSRNGTLLNGDRVARVPLEPGDRVQLGPATILQLGVFDETEEALAHALYEASTRDPLTRAFNRRYFFQRLDVEVAYARRHEARLAVLLIDLDDFKRVNDTYGHVAGDEALRAVANAVADSIRTEDLLARYGGEEFALLVRETPLQLAQLFAERIRHRVDGLRVPCAGEKLRVTCSIGVAELSEIGESAAAERLVSLADKRLYLAKSLGRNRVVSGS
jgi:diguanylate cyclase (GGDEF)-like protein